MKKKYVTANIDDLVGKPPLKLDELIGYGVFIQNHQTRKELLHLLQGSILYTFDHSQLRHNIKSNFRIFKVYWRTGDTKDTNDHGSITGHLQMANKDKGQVTE